MNRVEAAEISNLPYQYRPLSPWAYFGYSLLFSLPVIGLISLILLSFNNNNINRRNYARSFFCIYAVALILLALLAGTMVVYGPEVGVPV